MNRTIFVPDFVHPESAAAKRDFDAGHFDQALDRLNTLARAGTPLDATSTLLRARANARLGHWRESVEDYEALFANRVDLALPDVREFIASCKKIGNPDLGIIKLKEIATGHPQQAAIEIEIGDLFRDQAREQEAESSYRQAVQTDPRNIAARLRLGHLIRRTQGPEHAIPYFQAAMEINPGDRWARLALAEVFRDLGRSTDAEREYQHLVDDHHDFFQAQLGLGHLIRRRAGAAAAAPHFDAALRLAPNDRWTRLAVADMKRELGAVEEAESIYRTVLTDAPAMYQAHLGLAHCIRARSGMTQALFYFEQALANAPRDPWCRLYVADGLRELGRRHEAEQVYRDLLSVSVVAVLARIGLGLCLRQGGRVDEALAEFLAVLQQAPSDARARALALECLGEQRRWTEALALIDRWLDIDPDAGSVMLAKARIVRRRDGLARSAPLYAQALERLARDAGASRECAAALREAGELTLAESTYARLILDNPQDTHARIGLAQCSFERGFQGTAMVQLADCIGAGLPDRHAVLEVARLARDWSNLELARRALSKAIEGAFCADPEIWLMLGAVESAAGDSRAAIEAYRQGQLAAPQRHDCTLALAAEQLAAGEIANADETLAALCAIENLSSDVLARISEHHMRCGLLDAALDYALEAYEAESRTPMAVMTLARTLAARGHVEPALEVLEDGAEQFGRRPEFYALGSVILRAHGRVDGARALLAEFLAEHPATTWIAFELVQIELDSGALDAAEARLESIRVSSRSDHAHSLFLRAQVSVDRWQLETAVGQYEAAIAEAPQLAYAHHALAICHLLLGRTAQARAHARAFTDAEAPQRRARGRPLSVWYSQLGQLLDEYSFDREALARIENEMRRPPLERLDALRAIGAEQMRMHTPSAIALMVSLRAAGALEPAQRLLSGDGSIPRILMQYWHEPEIPDDLVPYVESWQALNPELTYCPLDDAAAQAFLQSHCETAVLEAYRRAQEPTKRADLIRLAWLHVNGGFYADVDDVCLRPIEEFMPAVQFLCSQEAYGTLLNNFIGVIPRHPVIGMALNAAVEAIQRGDADRLWLSTGPALLTRAFASVWASDAESGDRLLAGSHIMTRAELARYVTAHCQTAYKRNPRHWSLVEPQLVRRRTDWARHRQPASEAESR